MIGYKALVDDLKRYKDQPKYQRLVIEFEKGEDPDDAYSQAPYEKGSNFLLYLGMYLISYMRKLVIHVAVLHRTHFGWIGCDIAIYQ